MTEEQFDKLNKMKVGRALRYLRKSKGLTCQQLADMTSTQKYWISNVENAKSNFQFSMLIRVMYVLGVTIDEFTEYMDSPIH